jgi:beta-N-acetylhexosaminidase
LRLGGGKKRGLHGGGALKPVILGVAGASLLPEERGLFLAHRPRGVILFSRNIENPVQLAELMIELRAALPEGAVLMVDQEGGRVARLRPPHWPALPPAATLRTEDLAHAHGLALGTMVRDAGFDIAAAPVLDLYYKRETEVIGDRAISGDAKTVAALGGKLASGIIAAGVVPVMKHIPGHGRARVDSHVSLPRVPEPNLTADFYPFAVNRDLPWAMTAHIVYEAYDPYLPATLSKTVIERVIRGVIGFKGTLISDDLAMQALTGTPAERATAALAAGCDIALYCPGDMAGNRAILEAVVDS